MRTALESKNPTMIERSIIETKALFPGQNHELVDKAEKTMKALDVRRGMVEMKLDILLGPKKIYIYVFTVRRPSLIFGPDPKLFYCTFS